MFDAVRNNKKIVQGFLVLITLPFAFWGVESYVRNAGDGGDAATVGSAKISLQELQGALREQQDRLRAQLGGRIDPAMFDTPMMRRAVLETLVGQRLMAQQAQKSNLVVTNNDLAQFIASVPALQENGKFSPERYASLVASQGMSKEVFEARLRQDMTLQQQVLPLTAGSIAGAVAGQRWVAAQLEQRDVAEVRLTPDAYVAQVKLAADAAQKFYEANRKKFELPEQVRVEYLTLGKDALAAQNAPTEEEIKARYQAAADRFKEPETRRASHILIPVAKDAADAAVKAAQAKAEEVLALAKKTPADFAKLAKQYSQDPGSATKGGDLDWIGRGMMVKPFEDSVFSLKDGQMSELVRSDFGFHIIRLTGIRAERVKPYEEVKAELVAELKRDLATKKYAEAAEAFGNTVYEQADSLKPAADKWKLSVRQSEWLPKGGRLTPPFDNPKLAAAIFSDDAIKNKRNTEAVEVASGVLVAARVVEHKPASVQELASVKAQIEQVLTREEAAKLAQKDGEEKLAKLSKGEAVELKWSPVRSLSRIENGGLPPEAARAVFKVDGSKLPGFAGASLPGGAYALYRVGAVKAVDAGKDEPKARELNQHYARLVAEEEFTAWMIHLRQRFPVEVHKAALETSKER